MDRLRRSFRESFRRKKDAGPEMSRTHQWQADEAAVRGGTCNFNVKYLGCVEVYESRGMQVCEEALKLLKSSRRRTVKGVLQVSGDALRVVDNEFKGLIVDQTIEKVSFCAPDRNHERGFSYICRDGTTRRWMCHGFIATKESGERLSHAVGCAFAVCLERKQKREKDLSLANNSVTCESPNGNFARSGSFRAAPLTERLQDPQKCKLPMDPPPPVKRVVNPHAIERPHAAPHLLLRQGSFRGFPQLNDSSPFKRQLSLRIAELPSNISRQQSLFSNNNGKPAAILENCSTESSDVAISAKCQELSQGLSNLYSQDDPFLRNNMNNKLSRQSPLPAVPPRSFSHSPPAVSPSAIPHSAAVPSRNGAVPDPFDAEWAAPVTSVNSPQNTNPFLNLPPVIKAFQAHV